MKFIVTGSDGFVGSHLVQGLAKHHQVTAISRRPQALRRNFLSGMQNVNFIRADLVEPLPNLDEVDVIVHAAARTPSTDAKTSDYAAGNVLATKNVIDAAIKVHAKIVVYLSAISIYGRIDSQLVDEQTPIRDPSDYGKTKYDGEILLEDVSETLPSLIFRLPVVVGPSMETGWLYRSYKTLSEDQTLKIYNGSSPYNMVSVSDVLDLVLLGANQKSYSSDVFTVSCLEPLSIRQSIEIIKVHLGSKSEIHETSTDDQGYVVSTEKIRRVLGFKPSRAKDILAGYLEDTNKMDPTAVQ